MRPPGYEPGELPTAPHRDIINSFLNCECKGTTFFVNHQIFLAKSYLFNTFLTFRGKKNSIWQIKIEKKYDKKQKLE